MKRLAFILIAALFAGCDNGDEPTPQLGGPYLLKVRFASSLGNSSQSYSYDAKGRITRISTDGKPDKIEIAYNSFDNVQSISETVSVTLAGSTTQHKTVSTILFQGETPISVEQEKDGFKESFLYTVANNKITELKKVTQGPAAVHNRFTYSGNNIVKVEELNGGSVISTLDMTYGTGKSPRANSLLKHAYADEYLFLYLANDLTGSTLVDSFGKVVTSYAYTYNESGLPSKVEVTKNYFKTNGAADGTVKETITYEYL